MSNDIWLNKMRESTGVHMMDSGGATGRHWQRNQDKTDEQLRENKWDIWVPDDVQRVSVSPIISVANVLNDWQVCHLDKEYQEFANLPEYAYDSHVSVIDAWLESKGVVIDQDTFTHNTYESDNILSQVIQYTRFKLDDEVYWIIQLHNGADIRGGYTEPVVCYNAYDDYINEGYACASCPSCKFYMYTDDAGNNWYKDDGHYLKYESLDWLKLLSVDRKDVICPDCQTKLTLCQ